MHRHTSASGPYGVVPQSPSCHQPPGDCCFDVPGFAIIIMIMIIMIIIMIIMQMIIVMITAMKLITIILMITMMIHFVASVLDAAFAFL